MTCARWLRLITGGTTTLTRLAWFTVRRRRLVLAFSALFVLTAAALSSPPLWRASSSARAARSGRAAGGRGIGVRAERPGWNDAWHAVEAFDNVVP
jgi:hypothetical protein